MKNQADKQYNEIIKRIHTDGISNVGQTTRTKWKDGTPAHTKSIISQKMIFDNSEVPILTSKKVGWENAIKELLWIWQMKSNKVQDLRDMGVNIWNEWEMKDGTIGRAYGYQLAKKNRKIKFKLDGFKRLYMNENNEVITDFVEGFHLVDQVDYLLHELKNNPASRRHITTLWNPDDLDSMSLLPCVYETQWYVNDNKLSLEVRARSNDMALGNPFNVFQYNVLQRMIAQVTGYELGDYIYNIGDCHIYTRHLDSIIEQVNSPIYETPTLWINPEITSFYDFTIDDFKLHNYKHGDFIPYEVAI